MAYVSLYRKYRSQTFDDVVGQDHVTRTIRNAIRAGRVAQGYLFCGSRGTGKTTVARLIAKALNCMTSDGPTPDPCNECEACKTITEGTAVDVVEMDAASNRGIDDIREITDSVKYPPMRLRYKVYIIDEAHQVTREAKDAFLKTLEEPPPHAVFILATTEAHKIPITIRSRCQQFDFRPGTLDHIVTRLKHVVKGEGTDIEDEAVELLARSANGSYRDSLSLLEQVMAYTEGGITAKDVNTVLGMVDEEALFELGDVLATTDTASVFNLADKLLSEGRDAREVLKSAANHFRDLLAIKVGAQSVHRNEERWKDQVANFSQERLVRIIDVFSAADKDLRWNDQHRLGLEMALLKAMQRQKEPTPVMVEPSARSVPAAPKHTPVRDVEPVQESVIRPKPKAQAPDPVVEPSAKLTSDEVSQSVGETESAVVEPDSVGESETAASSVTVHDVQRSWQKILQHLQRVLKNGSVAAAVRIGQPTQLNGTVLTISFGKSVSGFHLARVQEDGPKLAQAIEDVLGVRLSVKAVKLEDDPDLGGMGTASSEVSNEPVQHPLMPDVLNTFGGTVVDDDKDPWEE